MISQIVVDLQERKDNLKEKYLVGWLTMKDIPVEALSVERGLTFLVFLGDGETTPQLVIRSKLSDADREERKAKRDRDGREEG
jgi:hypothetical protein